QVSPKGGRVRNGKNIPYPFSFNPIRLVTLCVLVSWWFQDYLFHHKDTKTPRQIFTGVDQNLNEEVIDAYPTII
ncbi:hypothetical protein CEN47_02295, partial [Fischerella thermalis CCMEE 5319]